MAKYKIKSTIKPTVEAVQFLRKKVDEVYDFTNGNLHSVMIPRSINGVMIGEIDVSNDSVPIIEKDYVIKNEAGFSIVKQDIFEVNYELMDNEK